MLVVQRRHSYVPCSRFTRRNADDPIEMALRHLVFDIVALGRIAAMASGSSKCTDMVIGEGRLKSYA
jgi:hypothetical protein